MFSVLLCMGGKRGIRIVHNKCGQLLYSLYLGLAQMEILGVCWAGYRELCRVVGLYAWEWIRYKMIDLACVICWI